MTVVLQVEVSDGDEPAPRGLRSAFVLLVAATIIVGWAPRLLWGLKLDETFTAWQADGCWAITRTKLANPGQSILFGYIQALFYFPGAPHMELWLRLPAIAGALISAVFVYRLAESFVGRGASPTALLPFFGQPR